MEADSRIAAEKPRQTLAPAGRERDLYKAIQSLILLREQQKLEEKLLLLTREEANTARIRYDAGILVEADTDTIALLVSTFSDTTKVDAWIAAARQADLRAMRGGKVLP